MYFTLVCHGECAGIAPGCFLFAFLAYSGDSLLRGSKTRVSKMAMYRASMIPVRDAPDKSNSRTTPLSERSCSTRRLKNDEGIDCDQLFEYRIINPGKIEGRASRPQFYFSMRSLFARVSTRLIKFQPASNLRMRFPSGKSENFCVFDF